ncbi:carboxypeptidase-like regulatory domain-containing protein [Patulibacter brassicae]|uniref:Carboxypeptidase-like regulatory domain-containing protein n=1 Tax=Patulibacter brassicae TaxID=1705717 RepID=A0ABU4VNE7_9ACTN|nr:carboxypeptidase-like regulatory domain-containing protein [Patulibacter brassicae]
MTYGRSARRRIAAVVLTLGVAAAIALGAPRSVEAGIYAMNYCGADGTADGFTVGATDPGRGEVSCTGTSPLLLAELPFQAWGEGSTMGLTFTAPDGVSIVEWRPHLTFHAFKQDSGANERFRLNVGAIPSGTFPLSCADNECPGAINGAYPAFDGARQVEARVTCVNEVPDSNLCKGSATLIDTGGQILLKDSYAPSIRAAVTGTVPQATTPARALRGQASIGGLVEDVGSGVARTELLIDGQPVAGTGNGCTPQPTSKRVPCGLAQNASINWNTVGVSDGGHTAALVATDASGNQATLWQGRVLVANQPIGPGSPEELRGNPTAPGVSDGSKITATFPATRKRPSTRCTIRSYRRHHPKTCRSRPARSIWKGGYSTTKTVVVTGRVTNAAGQPVPGAPVQLTGTVSRGPAARWETTTRTSQTGRWTTRVPRNIGSRTLEIRTFAREFDEVPAARTAASLLVRSRLALRVSRRSLRPGDRIRFRGQIADRASGVPVALEVHYRGKWRVFEAVSTKAGGRFRASYRFSRSGTGSYRFRARTRPTRATPYPYLSNVSPARRVRVR